MTNRKAYDVLMKAYPFTLEDLDGERWRNICGYEGLYQISTFGRVKSFWLSPPRILKPVFDNGYLKVSLCKGNIKGRHRVNRLVAEAFIERQIGKNEVNHIDGCKLNNYVGNLEWASRVENAAHAKQNGLYKSGGECSWAKLTNEQIDYIRENPDNLKCAALARMFSVNNTTISRIQVGKTYRKTGGTTRSAKQKPPRVPEKIRAQIRAEYVKGSKEYGGFALAQKYNLDRSTVWKIAKGK